MSVVIDVHYPSGVCDRQTISLLKWIRLKVFGKVKMFHFEDGIVYLTKCECCDRYFLTRLNQQ